MGAGDVPASLAIHVFLKEISADVLDLVLSLTSFDSEYGLNTLS